MRVVVTGASGFVGGAVASALAIDGHDVVGCGRTPQGWVAPAGTHGSYVVWDVTSSAPSTLERPDAIVHAAALADDWAGFGEAMRANATGTRTVAEAWGRPAGARPHFVHISTSSVYDAVAPTVMGVETDRMPTRFLSAYSASKAAAERSLAGRRAIILRPHAVYGPGDTTLLPRLIAGVRRSRLMLPAGGAVLHTLTHIDNLVEAVRLALMAEAAAHTRVFNVGDAEPVLLSAALEEVLARAGRRGVKLGSLPYRVAFEAARASEALARVTGRRPRLTRYAVSQLGLERTLDLGAARRELGYDPAPTNFSGAEGWLAR
jgi:2-alkyl-3-oxoalkanoate reductase